MYWVKPSVLPFKQSAVKAEEERNHSRCSVLSGINVVCSFAVCIRTMHIFSKDLNDKIVAVINISLKSFFV